MGGLNQSMQDFNRVTYSSDIPLRDRVAKAAGFFIAFNALVLGAAFVLNNYAVSQPVTEHSVHVVPANIQKERVDCPRDMFAWRMTGDVVEGRDYMCTENTNMSTGSKTIQLHYAPISRGASLE